MNSVIISCGRDNTTPNCLKYKDNYAVLDSIGRGGGQTNSCDAISALSSTPNNAKPQNIFTVCSCLSLRFFCTTDTGIYGRGLLSFFCSFPSFSAIGEGTPEPESADPDFNRLRLVAFGLLRFLVPCDQAVERKLDEAIAFSMLLRGRCARESAFSDPDPQAAPCLFALCKSLRRFMNFYLLISRTIPAVVLKQNGIDMPQFLKA